MKQDVKKYIVDRPEHKSDSSDIRRQEDIPVVLQNSRGEVTQIKVRPSDFKKYRHLTPDERNKMCVEKYGKAYSNPHGEHD